MHRHRRTLLTVAGTAVASIVLGFLAATRVVAPADSAARAEAPPAGPVTAPVERRVIESRVVTRGDTSFAGAVEVTLPAGELPTAAVVTGRVPAVGDTIEEGAVALEVVGRPVIALSGELPVYRTLRPGLHGPDVAQLEEVLARLGLDPGPVDDRYDAATGEAVAELFRRAGYEPPALPAELDAEVAAARQGVAAAEQAVAAAGAALQAASMGPPPSARLAAAAAVRAAERALEAARAGGDPHAVAAAEEQLAVAQAQEAELVAPRGAGAEHAAARAAQRDLGTARQHLAEVEAAIGTPAPATELVFLPSLPRRVDQVDVRRGSVVEGPAMVVSGADLVVTAPVSEAERQLLAVGMPVLLEQGTTTRLAGAISSIGTRTGPDPGPEVRISPEPLPGQQAELLRGANLRVTIPVQSTGGEVLAVPLAALSAGPGGESRVEVDRAGQLDLVSVEVGLAADGYAEVRLRDGGLEAGDRVVVGW